MKKVQLITDGACLGNPGPGGWAAVLRFNDKKKEIWNSEKHTTNNRMELTAAIEGLKSLREQCEVEVVTDSEYVKNGITTWIHGWKRKGWLTAAKKPVVNQDLWQALDEQANRHKIYLDLDQRARQPHRQQSLRRTRHARGTGAVFVETDMDALTLHRLHFAFTITFHYLFPQLTMGLALLILILKTMALRTGNEHYNHAARFWAKIFAINFAMGVVTGIPMEFQFGTNWSRFSKAAGGVIGQTLAMEGVFSFFLESSFLGVFLFGEKRLGPKAHWFAALPGVLRLLALRLLHHRHRRLDAAPRRLPDRPRRRDPAHQLLARSAAQSVALLAVSAQHDRRGGDRELRHGVGRRVLPAHAASMRTTAAPSCALGVIAGTIAAFLMLFPTGDGQGKNIACHQPVTLAAMEGLFETEHGAPLAILGQPDLEKRRLDNPLIVPRRAQLPDLPALGRRSARASMRFPQDRWPDNIPLLYYSYHIMVGLGTIFIARHGAGCASPVARRALPSRARCCGC